MEIDDLMNENSILQAQADVASKKEPEAAPAPVPDAEPAPVHDAEPADPAPITDPSVEIKPSGEPSPALLNNETVLAYLNKNREKEITSLDELFQEPKAVEKFVNPHEHLYDDYDKSYFKFKEETGLGRKEFDFVQQDFSKKSPLELAYDKVRKDNKGANFSDEQIGEYLEQKLSLDLSTKELRTADAIELNSFVSGYKAELTELQAKYKTTARVKKQEARTEAMVTLENGTQLPKSQYEKQVKERDEYISNVKEAVSSAAGFETEFVFDSDGSKQTSKFNYEYSETDKHSMLSNISDVDSFISKKFRSDKGFDYKGFATFIDKAENFDKYAALISSQARAEAIEEKIASDNNEHFSKNPKPLDKKTTNTVDSLLEHLPTN